AATLAEGLAAFLLEDTDLFAARLAGNHRDDAGVRHEGRACHDRAVIRADEEHLVDADLFASVDRQPIHGNDGSGAHFDLAAAALNDREHASPPLVPCRPEPAR